MIERLVNASLRHRWLVLFAAAAMVAVGVYRAGQMPVDVFPDLSAPRVTVVTESSGMAAEEVETLVTFPIETAVEGTAGVRHLRSSSAPGISVVNVDFDWDTPDEVARQRVTERLQSMSEPLPPQASAPLLSPASSVMGEIVYVALTSDELDPLELRRVADVQVRRQLLGTPGVSQVVSLGGEIKQYHLLADPHRLDRYELTLADLTAALEGASENAAGGYVVDGGQEWVVRVLGRAEAIADLEDLLVATRAGAPIRVRDVADVEVGPRPPRGAGSYRGEDAIILSVVKEAEADTLATTRRVDDRLDDLERSLEARGVSLHRDIFRQADFITRAVDNLTRVLQSGGVLVVGVLLLFLWALRPTVISAVAIPFSILVALVFLDLAGLRIDTMTLGGLAIAIGLLVDDAIVVVENCTRHLRARSQLPPEERPSAVATVGAATVEIRQAIVSTTVVLALVFVPLLLLGGFEGRLLQPLALAFLLAVAASTLVAFTLTPILCALFARDGDRAGDRAPPLVRAAARIYEPVLAASLRRPGPIAAGALAVSCAAALALTGTGRAFLPDFNEGSLNVSMVLEPGTSLDESDALARQAEDVLLEDPAVRSVGRRTGRAERDDHVMGVESSEMEVPLYDDDPRSKDEIFADVRERLRVIPGARFSLDQPISHRIEHMISGHRHDLSIRVFGPALGELRRTANEIERAVEDIPGLVDLQVQQVVEVPQLVVRVDRHAASTYGFSTGAAASAVSTALWGQAPLAVYEDGTTTDVVVKYDERVLGDVEAVERAGVPTPAGALVPVSALAEVYETSGPNHVFREGGERRLAVNANVAGGDVGGVYDEVRDRVAERVEPPQGVRIDYSGEFARQERAGRHLLIFGGLALVGIGFVVAAALGSARRALLVLANLPVAMAGGVVGVYLSGGILSVSTTIGFITLLGVAARNGILLATRVRDLEREEIPTAEAVPRAARERLAPILMTAITAALGLLPLALALGQPGSEIQAPMALVILTGLVTSTALNMIIVPALLARFGGRAPSP